MNDKWRCGSQASPPLSHIGLSRADTFIQHTTENLNNSDQATLTEHTNLSNRLPDLRLIAIGLANVERS